MPASMCPDFGGTLGVRSCELFQSSHATETDRIEHASMLIEHVSILAAFDAWIASSLVRVFTLDG
eukprot:14677607-Alexandrium_andersonii.AAC.1